MAFKESGIRVAVYLRGEHLQPDYISKQLRILPSHSQQKGRLREGSQRVLSKIGVWALVAKAESSLAKDHIEELLKCFENADCRLTSIEGVQEAYLDILVDGESNNVSKKLFEVSIGPDHLKKLERLGLGLQFTAV